MPVVTLVNGNQHKYESPISPLQVANKIDPKLSDQCIAVRINNKLCDITTIINNDSTLEFITIHDELGLNIVKLSCVYLLGYTIKQLWPMAKLFNSSICEAGFYYDIDLKLNLNEQELCILEKKMFFFAKKANHVINSTVSRSQAIQFFLSRGETYKAFFIKKNMVNTESLVQLSSYQGYTDISCEPNFYNINFCRYCKLYKISNLNYNDRSLNVKILQRIHGSVLSKMCSKKLSNNYVSKSKKLKKYDHRHLANQLDLYHIQENAPGMIFWHENGLIIFQALKNFIRTKLKQYKYKEVKSPIMIDRALWEKTGHWENYHEHIFTTTSENREYCIKPMNCPGHIQIFNCSIKSYKDLPFRLAEFGSCHRNEYSGSLHGLMRTREFTQDDAHIFCTEDQIYSELDHCIKMMYDIYNTFGFKNIIVNLSTRPKRRIGNELQWDTAEQLLSVVLKKNKISFQYQPDNGAFYGPKIEFTLCDSLNRSWQCGTIQLDFSLTDLLDVYYVDRYNKHKTPVIIHRAILGSIERFLGLLIEEYLGFFPTWLAPVQIVLLNVTHEQFDYINNLEKKLIYESFRVKTDLRNETIGSKIRLYTLHRVPYMLICGKLEMDQGTISIRTYKGKVIKNYDINVFIKKLKNEIFGYSMYQMEE